MTSRHNVTLTLAVLTALAAGGARLAASGSLAAATKAALAGLLAAGVIALAVSLLPRRDAGPARDGFWRGVVVGGCFVGAGLLSWTFTDRPIMVWALLLVEGVVFAVWSWPWLRHVLPAARLGGAWLGVAYWLLGIVGALLVAHWQIAAERLAYAGVFGLAVLAVLVRSRARDLTAGMAAAFVFALGAVLLAGSGNLFEPVHAVPDNGWGVDSEYRFWGGEWLFYQPNSMAALAIVAAIRVGADSSYALWQRLAVLVLAGYLTHITNSRTGVIILATAAVAHAGLLWLRGRRPVAGLPEYRRPGLAAATPFLVLAVVLGLYVADSLSPAQDRPGLTQSRYGDGGVTSGRLDTWTQVYVDWRDAGVAEKLFGDASTTRAVVTRASSGDVQLTTDNAAVGALRRGGALGVAAFLLGLGLLLRRAGRRDAPAWFIVAVLTSLPPIMTSDALLGGTGGTVWVLLLAGEAYLVCGAVRRSSEVPALVADGSPQR